MHSQENKDRPPSWVCYRLEWIASHIFLMKPFGCEYNTQPFVCKQSSIAIVELIVVRMAYICTMLRPLITTALLVLSVVSLRAQIEYATWVFGVNAAVRFTIPGGGIDSIPTVIDGR